MVALAVAAGMFPPDEVEPLREVLDGLHAGHSGAGPRLAVWADDPDGPPIGVVYFGPDAMTDRKWDLWMIAVAPGRQGQGIGGQLVEFAEAHVREERGRLLLIDTSSLPKYEATGAFYRKHGYAEVARIPDFYTDGDSKVVYAKRMAPEAGGPGEGAVPRGILRDDSAVAFLIGDHHGNFTFVAGTSPRPPHDAGHGTLTGSTCSARRSDSDPSGHCWITRHDR